MQAGINPPKDRKERQMREGERERHTFKGKGELYNMPQFPTLPPKWPRSGVTFHLIKKFPDTTVHILREVVFDGQQKVNSATI